MKPLSKKSAIRKTALSDGLIILSENLPSYTSISVGVWIKAGSRDELPSEKGIAHFLEHMVFQGTKRRTSYQIADALESVGGSINAFTAKEETCYYAHCLPKYLSLATDLLADMVCNPSLAEDGIAKEKTVIREEINSVLDTPDDYIFDILQEKSFPKHAMGYPILGEKKSISNFDSNALRAFWSRYYRPENMVVCVAGDVDHDTLVGLVESHFIFNNHNLTSQSQKAPPLNPPDIGKHILKADVSQAHYSLAYRTDGFASIYRLPLIAINHYLGEGMTARLFRVLREEHAYVYSVYSFIDFFKDSGMFGVYLGTDLKNIQPASELARDEIRTLSLDALSKPAIESLKRQLEGSFLLSLETTFKHMSRLFKSDLYFGEVRPVQAVIKEINDISPDILMQTSELFLGDEQAVSVLLSPEGIA